MAACGVVILYHYAVVHERCNHPLVHDGEFCATAGFAIMCLPWDLGQAKERRVFFKSPCVPSSKQISTSHMLTLQATMLSTSRAQYYNLVTGSTTAPQSADCLTYHFPADGVAMNES